MRDCGRGLLFGHNSLPERMIGFGRLALAAIGLLAVYVDPIEADGSSTLTEYILWGYLLSAVVIVGMTLTQFYKPNGRRFVAAHVLDILVATAIIALTNGPTSPFFVLFPFVIVTGALRWGARAAFASTGIAVVVFLGISVTDGADVDIDTVIVRCGFLLVTGFLIGYLAAVLARIQGRVALLAHWPVEEDGGRDIPVLDRTLAHAATITGAAKIAVGWEVADEPFSHRIVYEDGVTCAFTSLSRDATPDAAPPGQDDSDRGESGAVRVPFAGRSCDGHVTLEDFEWPDEQVRMFADVLASRIAIEIEGFAMRRDLTDAAELRGRANLARDVHDGLLQTLAAASLQLKRLQRGISGPARQRIGELLKLVNFEQDRLREFISSAGSAKTGNRPFDLVAELGQLMDETARHWQVKSVLNVEPNDAQIPRPLGVQLSLLVTEAIANGARHGSAQCVAVYVACTDHGLVMRISDDGTGIEERKGEFDHDTVYEQAIGSHSLRERVRDLNGRLSIMSSHGGTVVNLEIPV